jgi:hypothetical protein
MSNYKPIIKKTLENIPEIARAVLYENTDFAIRAIYSTARDKTSLELGSYINNEFKMRAGLNEMHLNGESIENALKIEVKTFGRGASEIILIQTTNNNKDPLENKIIKHN